MGISYGKLMMWFFLMSDAFTFSGLLITYGLVRSSNQAYEGTVEAFQFATTHWPIPEKVFESVPFLHGVSLPLVFVGFMTFVLIMSSVTMVLAVEAGHRMDRVAVEKWMLWTIVGLATIIVLVGFAILLANAVWFVYRIAKGWTDLNDHRAVAS